jgi:Cof subfamily protein (haloacid dehalogenase superfamily)
MIKLIVSDLDGTLLDWKKEISPKDAAAVQKAVNTGIDFCLASGRMDNEIGEILKTLGHKFHRISQNGAFIYTKDDVQLHSKTFTSDLAHQIYEKTRLPEFITLVCNFDTNFVEQRNEIVIKLEERMFHPIVEQRDMCESIKNSIITPSKITVLGEHEAVVRFQETIKKAFGDEVDTFISEKQCLDIMPKNISKGNALMKLIEHLGLKSEEIACIGDSFNDIPMFRLTPHSFVMSHAHSDVKKEANHVVETVHEAIEMILEKNKVNV